MADGYLLAQGQAKPATQEDLYKDASGVTYPNLHRRIDTDYSPRYEYRYLQTAEGDNLLTAEGDPIVVNVDMSYIEPAPVGYESPYEYALLVQGVDSYRNTHFVDTDENSEIP